MVVSTGSIEEFIEYLKSSKAHKDIALVNEYKKIGRGLFSFLKKEGYLKTFSQERRNLLADRFEKSLELLKYGAEFHTVVVNAEKTEKELKSIGLDGGHHLLLLICFVYNMYSEKIKWLFENMVDLVKLTGEEREFYYLRNILNPLKSEFSDSKKLFDVINIDLRNSIAHFSFEIDKERKGIIYGKKLEKFIEGGNLMMQTHHINRLNAVLNLIAIEFLKSDH